MSTHAEALVSLCRRYPIDILYVFGSRADEIRCWLAGDHLTDSSSDVDICIRPVAGFNLSVLLRRAGDLAPLERERLAMILGDD